MATQKEFVKTAQQGDVNIWVLKGPPEGVKLTKKANKIVREGEATGHMHEIIGEDCDVFVNDDGTLCFAEVRKPATLVHPEHGPITLEPGWHEFGPTHEYDYDAAELRVLAD